MDVTWKLKPNITWHDGTPHTSADVKFTVEAINSPAYNPESTDGFDRITSVDTPDPLTAVLHYDEVYAPYQLQFMRGTLPKHVLEGRDIDTANDYNRAPLGTGPYRVAEWKTGEFIRLEAVPNYWQGGGQPRITTLLFKFIPNTNTRINQLKSGEVDMVVMFPWDKHREVAAIPGVRVQRTDGNGYEHVTMNQRAFPAFADVRVRQALIHAVDRELITTTILEGLAPITHGPVQPVSWAHNPQVRQYPFDQARAKALLDEAGWRDSDGDGVRDKDGQRFAFTLITQAGFAVRENVAQVLQRQFKDVGVEAAVQLHDGTSISKLWFEGKFHAMLHWWQLPADPELTLFFAKDRMPPRGRNINYVSDDALTALVYAADRSVEPGRTCQGAGRGPGADRRSGHRDSPLRREQARRGAGPAQGLHRQPHQHRSVLERPHVDDRVARVLRLAGRRARRGRAAAGGGLGDRLRTAAAGAGRAARGVSVEPGCASRGPRAPAPRARSGSAVVGAVRQLARGLRPRRLGLQLQRRPAGAGPGRRAAASVARAAGRIAGPRPGRGAAGRDPGRSAGADPWTASSPPWRRPASRFPRSGSA